MDGESSAMCAVTRSRLGAETRAKRVGSEPCCAPRRHGKALLARGRVDDLDYAVKVLGPFTRHTASPVRREVQALAACSSPHICRYHTAWEEALHDGLYMYIVTEQCHASVPQLVDLQRGGACRTAALGGVSFAALHSASPLRRQPAAPLAPHKPASWLPADPPVILSEETLLDFTRHIGLALAEVHRQGWAHLDVKPSNILASIAPGEALVFKLADFGRAVKLGDSYAEEGDDRCVQGICPAVSMRTAIQSFLGSCSTLLSCWYAQVHGARAAEPGAERSDQV